jgi:hypothetical protein
MFNFNKDDIDPPGGANICPHCLGKVFSCEVCDGVGLLSDDELKQYQQKNHAPSFDRNDFCDHGETEETETGVYCVECGEYLGPSES